ncbi:MAG: UDP-N-acetylmuramoyl-L-alanyl-D-glutamate--2,6-diaminopimelate ligase [candidate division NC10 bacterium]|nr:UDP-N-acetylmuramoyl-L-alanyl-D-glutamate--2,6-diaminopimelate ligase [candidate division NC10 bacterium]
MRLKELIEGVDTLHRMGDLEQEIGSIHYDSRQVKRGSLFVAIRGFARDGHAYIRQAVEKGAIAIVVQSEHTLPPLSSPLTLLQVPDSRLALAQISANFYHHPSRRLRLIGVTGTNGKTTITYLIESIFSEAGNRVGVIGTINYRFGGREVLAERTTPESLDLQRTLWEMAEQGIDPVVMEVSSHSLELKRVEGCEFDLAIFTNLTRDHLDFHGDLDRYGKSKLRLFSGLGRNHHKATRKRALVNLDDPFAQQVLQSTSVEAWSYGLGEDCQIRASRVEYFRTGMQMQIDTPQGTIQVRSPLMGEHNVYNILAAVGAGLWADLAVSQIVKGIGKLERVPGRWERVEAGQRFTVVVDYAHTADALERILKAARGLCKGRVITVFGCGGDRDRGKRPLMGEVAAKYSDYFLITSDNPRSEDPSAILSEIEQGVQRAYPGKGKYDKMIDRREAIARAIEMAEEEDLVILAGKGHEAYQILKDRRIPFDDREVARACLLKRRERER